MAGSSFGSARRLAHAPQARRQLARETPPPARARPRPGSRARSRSRAEVEELALPALVEDELPAPAQHRSLRAASFPGVVGLGEELPFGPGRRPGPSTAARGPGPETEGGTVGAEQCRAASAPGRRARPARRCAGRAGFPGPPGSAARGASPDTGSGRGTRRRGRRTPRRDRRSRPRSSARDRRARAALRRAPRAPDRAGGSPHRRDRPDARDLPRRTRSAGAGRRAAGGSSRPPAPDRACRTARRSAARGDSRCGCRSSGGTGRTDARRCAASHSSAARAHAIGRAERGGRAAALRPGRNHDVALEAAAETEARPQEDSAHESRRGEIPPAQRLGEGRKLGRAARAGRSPRRAGSGRAR